MSPFRAAAATTLAISLLAGTSSLVLAEDAEGPLTVYSGRSESLVGPVLESFTEATGIEVVTKYADTAELVAILLEEGGRSPADIFFAQDAGALGAVADSALLARLPAELLAQVPPGFSDPGGEWVGVSGRARTAAYTTTEALDIPDSILGFTDPAWLSRIGWAPANGSFQAFVTALRVIEGEEGARAWLEGILANEPVAYPKNTAAVEGVAAGEVDVAFVNHYYLLRLLAEHGEDYPVAQAFFAGGDAGSLVNVAGVGQLVSSDQPDASAALLAYLLEDEAQRYFSEATFEFPLIEGIRSDARLPDFGSIEAPDVDLSALADLQGTVQLLREVGAID
jgi:iron(III) transport system substrate-binding protein